ncbi:MAG: tetratricopeptide repeat protein [Planctomycetaceae bacterium]|nr:tetratricopeptide repeat protein [Planctomycetaceae bacterium]
MLRTGEYAACTQSAAAAIDENAYNENFRLLKLRAEMELGRYGDALKTLDAALEKFPQSIQLRWLGIDVCRFNQQTERAAKLDAEIAQLLKRAAWQYSDVVNQVVVGRYLLSQGTDPKKVLDGVYNEVKRRQPAFVDVLLASGDLALEKHDYLLAGEAFQQAAKLDADNADAHFGVARAFAASDSEKANAALEAALSKNANHVRSLLLLADGKIDAEQYDEAEKLLAHVEKINPHHPRALAYRAVLAHLRSQPESEKLHRAAALKHWPANPEVDFLIGLKLSQKYRFAEGEQYQRQSLKFDPNFLPAKGQLAQDLLRLGREEEGWKLAGEVYDSDGYNVFAHNLVTLQDNLLRFRTLEEDGLLVRMDAREAEIYGRRVLALLKRAKHDLCAKYEVTLPEPIIVELFPKQEDFAIRTFGLPGGAGFLGVCFGTVITANSPASQATSPSCWEATLWHEFCHVVTLNKTSNKMPRWLSEGISVYEERQADSTWGQSMKPQFREMILGDDLVPVSGLSGAFLSPKSPLHLQFAYYESSLVVEYVIEKYGIATLKRVLVDLGVGMPINDSLGRYAGSIGALDAEFAKYARDKASAMAPGADWSEPELPRRASADMIAAYVKQHPNNYAALRRLAERLIADGKWQAAKEPLTKMRELYPNDAGAANPYSLLAQVHRELKETKKERAALEKLAELSADDVEMLARLTELTVEGGEWEATRKYALRWLAVNPLATEPHRRAAAAADALQDDALAVDSYRAILLLAPFDPAQAHLQLATALARVGDLPAAKRHALFALEETPRFRAAQRKLLEIVEAIGKNEDKPQDKNPQETQP